MTDVFHSLKRKFNKQFQFIKKNTNKFHLLKENLKPNQFQYSRHQSPTNTHKPVTYKFLFISNTIILGIITLSCALTSKYSNICHV